MRLDKFFSHLKYGSRRDMKTFFKAEVVKVNGNRITDPAYHIEPGHDDITLNEVAVFYEDPVHLVIHKPPGYLSANRDAIHPCVVELVNPPYDRFDYAIAGRLDLDAEGLMVLTTDGPLAHRITSPNSHLPKTYAVTLEKPFQHDKTLLKGVSVKDGKGRPYMAKALAIEHRDDQVIITIDEGKFHQVKRMFEATGHTVVRLVRLRIGNLALGDLAPGEHRPFKEAELYD